MSGVDPDIRRAHTLPGSFYRDPALFDLVRERAFVPAWHMAGDGCGPTVAHSAKPFTLLDGYLDEPLLLTRAADGVMRCLSNVCTHRGNLLVEEAGEMQRVRCGYATPIRWSSPPWSRAIRDQARTSSP